MKHGEASRTAVLACMGRAAAHATLAATGFSDPTAGALLPDGARERVRRYVDGAPPVGPSERLRRIRLAGLARAMAVRTLAIDEAIRAAACPQVVNLGAGLDGRAWRMPELSEATVIEVDHPDSQRAKRDRVASLARAAHDVRFVPVDFTRDDLGLALASAGHDAERPTTWVWEGVVMYLTPAEIAATLAVVARRSAAGSRLVLVYLQRTRARRPAGRLLRRLGEPLRSSFDVATMRSLLACHGFDVARDDDLPALGAAVSADLGAAMRHRTHQRVVVADRRV